MKDNILQTYLMDLENINEKMGINMKEIGIWVNLMVLAVSFIMMYTLIAFF